MFYDVFVELCSKNGISQSKAVESIGLNRSAITKWKNGAVPTGRVLNAFSTLFEVPVDVLLGNEKTPTAKSGEVSDDDIKFALFDGAPVTDAQFEEVKRFAKYVADRDIHSK